MAPLPHCKALYSCGSRPPADGIELQHVDITSCIEERYCGFDGRWEQSVASSSARSTDGKERENRPNLGLAISEKGSEHVQGGIKWRWYLDLHADVWQVAENFQV